MMASRGAGGGREGFTLSSNVDKEKLFDIETVAFDLLMRLVYSDAPIKEGKYMATAMDLRTLAAGLSDEQLLKAAATQLRVPVQDLDTKNLEGKSRANVEANYAKINRALQLSGEFIRDELKLPMPAEVANTRVNSPAELVALLKKTTVFKAGHTGLDRHLAYCALIKGALAAIELETRYAHDLAGEANYLQSIITEQRPENNHTPLIIGKPISTDDEISGTLSAVEGDSPCNVTFEIRDKTWQSLMRKFMSKPEANAKEAFKDAIAFRFQLDGRHKGTVERVLKFFKRQFEGGARMITNKGVMGQAEFNKLFASVKEIKGSRGLEVDPKSNPKSDPNFAVLQITGAMKVPPGGDLKVPKRNWRARSFELQFVDDAQKPPTGLASDAVYALKKDAVIATRLMGSFELSWLLEHAIPASLDTKYTNMTADAIVNGLIEQGHIIKKPGKRGKYAATETWENWLGIEGLIKDEKMQASLGHVVAEALQKKELAKKKKKSIAE
ncbi:hypothetical protein A3B35_00500 [Candidatus Kaiserbacteria bacterium RIFCSPLOWO2_01_FULL_54_24]|uniref:Uncharacterized protein n=1 Tax=Candidatus Kaiserbacteria bacterium RIFCSPLOWO2_01_FULL_54_24 TaxID=1798515 RepID=A0A1F6ET97_9BACT|nr:MAG: hypothetical protein A3B35_00500 [Candidatus Kaiserbacteria bacterium RIFCSPLOWO2_01_FULL_54_24]